MKRIHTQSVFLLIAAILTLGLTQAVLAKGPRNKVEVTEANPSVAAQGEMVDVIVSGSGFDQGSDVSYLVSGTTDASQVVVESVQYLSPNELLTKIRPKDSALVTSYDIEVRASSGRKGKGTTLFRVKQADVECSESEPKEPAIVFLGASYPVGDHNVSDLYLANESGCEQTLIAEGVDEADPENHVSIRSVVWLRLDTRESNGVVSWSDNGVPVGMRFTFDSAGNIATQPGAPYVFYQPIGDREVWGSDVRLTANNEVELVMLERDMATGYRRIVTYNVDTNFSDLSISDDCILYDPEGGCLGVTWPVFWGAQGDSIYLNVGEPSSGDPYDPYAPSLKRGIARMTRVGEVWGEPELLVLHEGTLKLESISATGVLVLDYEEVQRTKNGKRRGTRRAYGAIHEAHCESSVCSPLDGADLGMERSGTYYVVFTPDGRALVSDSVNRGQESLVREYSDPFSGESSRILIDGINSEFDTAY